MYVDRNGSSQFLNGLVHPFDELILLNISVCIVVVVVDDPLNKDSNLPKLMRKLSVEGRLPPIRKYQSCGLLFLLGSDFHQVRTSKSINNMLLLSERKYYK